MKHTILLIFLFVNSYYMQAQQTQYSQNCACNNKAVKQKTDELIEEYKKLGFVEYKGEQLTLENKTEMPIYIQLRDKKVYHFIVVGDPDLKRLEVKLGHRAFGGNEVNDQIIQNRDKTYFTHFTYMPPFTGAFLLTLYEKVPDKEKFCTSLYVMIREKNLDIPSQ